MSAERLSPEAQDKLAQKLRESLSQSRRRPVPWTLVGIAFVALTLAGLWFLNRPTIRSLPPLMLTCFDGLDGTRFDIAQSVLDQDQWAHAQLVAPGEPDANLEGFEIHWKILTDNTIEEAATTKTDQSGLARYRIGSAPLARDGVGKIKPMREVRVSFVDPAGSYRRDCHAVLFWPSQPFVIAMTDLVPGDNQISWTTTPISDLPEPRPLNHIKNWHEMAIFAAGQVDADTYRDMRAWLHHHQERQTVRLPRGPLLRERAEDLVKRLHIPWGE